MEMPEILENLRGRAQCDSRVWVSVLIFTNNGDGGMPGEGKIDERMFGLGKLAGWLGCGSSY